MPTALRLRTTNNLKSHLEVTAAAISCFVCSVRAWPCPVNGKVFFTGLCSAVDRNLRHGVWHVRLSWPSSDATTNIYTPNRGETQKGRYKVRRVCWLICDAVGTRISRAVTFYIGRTAHVWNPEKYFDCRTDLTGGAANTLAPPLT